MALPTSRIPLQGLWDDARQGVTGGARRVVHEVSRLPVANLALAGYRTSRWLLGSVRHGRRVAAKALPDVPESRLTAAIAAQVALDECVLAVFNNPSRLPEPEQLARVGEEMTTAQGLYRASGWLDRPADFHLEPPVLERPGVRPARWLGLRYECVTFDSGYEPHRDEPGRERWLGYEANRTGYAWVLRHRDGPRPWLVCLHGFGTGRAFMDLYAFRAAFLHHALGVNLAIPVLPMHGPRSIGRFSGAEFMSWDLLNVVHGMTQSVWDVRRLLSWIRATQDASAVGLYGVSLGGYLTALVGGVDGDLDCAIAGIPMSDLPSLFAHHAPERLRRRPDSEYLLGPVTDDVLKVVSPLALEPLVPRDRRFLYAGLVDRMATPRQAHLLWEHWERPRIAWYDGNHVGFLWSGAVNEFVREALATSGLARPLAA